MNGLVMLGLWSLAAALIALVACWAAALKWANENAGFSSWVQAIGSIAAIGIAVWVVQRQHGLERKRELESEAREQNALHIGALQLIGTVYRLGEKANQHPNESQLDLMHLCIELEGVANALGRIDILRFDTHLATEALLVAESAAKTLLAHMQFAHERTAEDGYPRWGPVRDFGEQTMALVKLRMDRLHEEILAAQKTMTRS